MRLPFSPCVPLMAGLITLAVVAAGFGGMCSWKNRQETTANGVVEIDGALTPSPIPVGTPHTMTVTVTNRGEGPVEVTGVEVDRILPDGRRAGTWSMTGRGFDPVTVGGGETATVFSRSGRNCGDAGDYEVFVVVHTSGGDFSDRFTYTFT